MKSAMLCGVLGAFAISSLATAAPVTDTPATLTAVHLAQGDLHGKIEDGAKAFLGIPYAQPPVGDLRWRPPVPASGWAETRDATAYGASCYQAPPALFGPYTEEFVASPPFSENCLFLNVWAPARGGTPLPVMVWFHGGGYNSGSGAIPIYDGARLAAKGAVVVTVNYRLGVFGYLAHPGLSKESRENVSGNYGLLDQISALQWVKANIARFGGDPQAVTIAGQSAGGGSVNSLLLSPRATGLFARVIAESGVGLGSTQTLAEAESQGDGLAKSAGVPDIAGLRALSPDRLVQLTVLPFDLHAKGPRPPGYAPIVDGDVLPAPPGEPRAKAASQVPLIAGFNTDEGNVFGMVSNTPEGFETMVRDRYGAVADRFLALYPHGDVASATQSTFAIQRDRYMANLVLWAKGRQQASGQRVYGYLFDHAYPIPKASVFRSFHTAEVPYVFGALSQPGRAFTAEDSKVSEQVQDYWLAFMRSGAPDGAGLRAWAPFDPETGLVMGLGDHPGPRAAVSSPERLRAFADFVAQGGQLSLF